MKLVRLVALALVSVACATPVATGSSPPTATMVSPGSPDRLAPRDPIVLAAAGDISMSGTGDDETAALIERLDVKRILTLGDNQYPDGAYEDFIREYDDSWGSFLARTLPTPGNHDCETAGCAGYFRYFGPAAADGHYAVEVGDWLIVSVNSAGDVDAEANFIRTTLAGDRHACQIVAWHHPRWSSGAEHGSETFTDPLWRASVGGGADVVLNGHDHAYERFALLTAAGQTHGLTREFVVGSGGASHYGFGPPIPGSQVQVGDVFGVLRMELSQRSYAWSYHSVNDGVLDRGSSRCH